MDGLYEYDLLTNHGGEFGQLLQGSDDEDALLRGMFEAGDTLYPGHVFLSFLLHLLDLNTVNGP